MRLQSRTSVSAFFLGASLSLLLGSSGCSEDGKKRGASPTSTAPLTATTTRTGTATDTGRPTDTPTPVPTDTNTPQPTTTATHTHTPTATNTETLPPTETPTDTPTTEPTATATDTETPTPEVTETAAEEPTETPTPEVTETAAEEPTATPTPTATAPEGTTLLATLNGDQEVGAVDTQGGGSASVVVSEDGASVAFELAVVGIDPGDILQAHIHAGPAGTNGPVVAFLASSSFQSPLSGTITAADVIPNADAGIQTLADLIDALRSGDTYVNVHTMAHPGGEVRGQLRAPTSLVASLSGDQEHPVVESDATGTAQFVLSADETELSYEVEVSGLEASQILQVHLHVAPAGINGPIVLFLTAGPPIQLPLRGVLTAADLIDNAEVGVESFADFVAALRGGDVYVNVHSAVHPSGEIRGQLHTPIRLPAALSGDQEVDPVVTEAAGTAHVILDARRSAMRFAVNVVGLATDQITQAHIHVGSPAVNGPVIFFLADDAFGSPRMGTLTEANLIPNEAFGIASFGDFVAALLAGNAYVNVHSIEHPGGEIRGQLQAPLMFTTTLSGDQEVDPVATEASGRARVVVDPERTGLRYAVEVSNLAADRITQAHIHVGPVGVNGPVVLFLADGGFSTLRIDALTATNLLPNPGVGVETLADFIAALRAGSTYVNVHSIEHPGGEIRGQLN